MHRLLELCRSVLLFIGHCHFIAELACETQHQPTKRLLEQFSGNRSPHLYAMEISLLNDYKARLCSLFEDALRSVRNGDIADQNVVDRSIRGLIRLFLGENALERDGMEVTRQMRLKIQNILGLDMFVPKFLRDNWTHILSGLRKKSTRDYAWKIIEPRTRTSSGASVLDGDFQASIASVEKERDDSQHILQWPGMVAKCNGEDVLTRKSFNWHAPVFENNRNWKCHFLSCGILDKQ